MIAYIPDIVESIYIEYNDNKFINLNDFILHKILYDILTHSSINNNIYDILYFYMTYHLKYSITNINIVKFKFNNKFYYIDINKNINDNYKEIDDKIQ